MFPARDPLLLENPVNRRAAVRSRLYALLAEAFSYPQGGGALRFLSGDLLGEIKEAMTALAIPLDDVVDSPDPTAPNSVQELQITYTALFDVTGSKPAVSMLERTYSAEAEQQLWMTLLAFYGHFGLDFSSGYAAEQPDHLLTQLGFMHYLAFLEAGSLHSGADLKRGQRDFVTAHLAAWIPDFVVKLRDAAPYALLAEALHRTVIADRDSLSEA